jgi:hypothetical protein
MHAAMHPPLSGSCASPYYKTHCQELLCDRLMCARVHVSGLKDGLGGTPAL